MTPQRAQPVLTKAQNELVTFLFEAQSSPIRAPLTAWVAASPRYAAFVEKYKDKIRKKLRVTRDAGPAADLLYELQIPAWLLQEPRFEVAYEPYAAGKTRGPDYAVTYRTTFTFNLEVTHIHDLPRTPPGGAAIDFHLVDVLCNKLRQMLGNMNNLLFVVSALAARDSLDLPAHIAWIKERAERSDPAFYTRQRFLNPADFFKYYERLSGIVLVHPAGAQDALVWLNPQTRVKLPAPVKNILQRGFG